VAGVAAQTKRDRTLCLRSPAMMDSTCAQKAVTVMHQSIFRLISQRFRGFNKSKQFKQSRFQVHVVALMAYPNLSAVSSIPLIVLRQVCLPTCPMDNSAFLMRF
jgi:hypothetical protein